MFELSPLGLVFFLFGLGYLVLLGRRLLPDRKPARALTAKYQMGRYFTLLVVHKKSSVVMRTAAEFRLRAKYDVTILRFIEATSALPRDSGICSFTRAMSCS